MKKVIFLAVCLLALNCKNRNNPGVSFNEIEESVNSESEEVTEQKNIAESFIEDSLVVHHHLKENRNNSSNNTIVIDLTSNPTEKEFKLSDLSESIEYIKLRHPDSLYFITGTTKVLFSNDLFITYNLRGICVFKKDGSFIDYVLKNEIEIFAVGRKVAYGMSNIKGVMSSPSVWNNQLIYVYTNVPEKYKILYSLDLSEIIDDGSNEIGKGMQLKKYNDSSSKGISSFFYLSDNILLGFNSSWTSIQSNELFYSFSNNGDTLCTFKNYDIVEEFGYRNYKVSETENLYRISGNLKYRQAYNDTIYKIINENTLEPDYILYRGNKSVSTLEGMAPGSDLFGKILIDQLYENNNWLIIVTCNNNSSPKNKRAGKIKFKYWFYNKITNQLNARLCDFENEHAKLKNNLNIGLDFWPTNVSNKGYLMSTIPVKYLLEDYSLKTLKESLPFQEFSNNELIITILK